MSARRAFAVVTGGGTSGHVLPALAIADAPSHVAPATGFAPGVVAQLPLQPSSLAYRRYEGLWLEIPSLGETVLGDFLDAYREAAGALPDGFGRQVELFRT